MPLSFLSRNKSTIRLRVGFKVPKGKGGSGASKSGIDKYVQENVVVVKEKVEPCPWVPDPVTGHYKPVDRIGVTDPAQLREVMLKH
ncbi:hypothetical protein ACHQM5_015217 [Ranunculus cassubicifolius]